MVTNSLKKILSDFPELNFDGCSSNYEDIMNIILKKKPELVFINLDNVMQDTFEFVKELSSYLETLPSFVAISNSQEFAYKAIKHNFIDYLINPLSELEIRKVILKFNKKHFVKSSRTLCLQSYKDFQYINTDEILFLKADNNTTDFYINDGTIISAYKTLKIFENSLPENFLRIHKSYIINKDFVSRINYGKLKCTVDNTSHNIPFTKTYINNIESIKNSLTDISIVN